MQCHIILSVPAPSVAVPREVDRDREQLANGSRHSPHSCSSHSLWPFAIDSSEVRDRENQGGQVTPREPA